MFSWGIIGPGRIAHMFARSIKEVDSAHIYAVASHNANKAQTFADEFGIENIFGSYEELAACDKIDAIYIATTNPYHHEPAILCLNSKKPVLCEKPLALNSNFAKAMVDTARANNVFFMEGMWTRFLPYVVQVREWLNEGMIGTPRMVKADFCVHGNPDPNDRWLSIEQGGGALLDLGIYPLSFASMVFGADYEAMSSSGYLTKTGVDEHCAIILKYPEGQIAQVSCSLFSGGPSRALILGTEGYIEVDDFVFSNGARLVRGNTVTNSAKFIGNATGFKFQQMEAQKCIEEGKLQSDVMPWDESLKIMKIIDRAKAEMGLKYPQE